ncbi:uncharacterized protein LOC143923117 isoform X2 [Arctopsyche grandis]|uniref:uncharacterized protein LOC143923117 isoform X2 n=1 Tax=Arctopsyche grandis TaxID=121162 RepID=UPI00406D9F2C
MRAPSAIRHHPAAAAAAARNNPRTVTFRDEATLVTGYLEPDNPWTHVEETSGEELVLGYIQSCRKHNTAAIESVMDQLKEMKVVSASCRQGTLTLAGCALTPVACEALESILKKVRFQRIDLHDCQLNDDAAVALFDMVEYYESATELDISGNKGLGIPAWQACSKMLHKCQWLEQLEIRDTSLSESSVPVLGRGLRPACSLRSLHLQRSRLAGAPLLCLAGFLKQNKSVRELHIGDNHLVASDAKHLGSMLKSNSSLQLLDISNNDIQDSGIEAIAEALAEQSSAQSSSSSSSSDSPMSSPQSSSSDRGLAVLIVWNNNLTRNSGNHFCKALSRCRSLEVLNIGQNPLCGETVNRFRSALQQNRSLLSLGMQSTKLGAEAAIAIAEVIEDNPVIQRIDLRDNKLQMAGLLALATALKKNHSVTRIDLDDAPPSQPNKEQPLEETRLVSEIRSLCKRNESQLNPSTLTADDDDSTSMQRRRAASFTTRKISLTCQTLQTLPEPVLSPPKTSTGRLRSPSPSPIPSPASSPIPSPSHRSRFQVSRVSDSSPGNSQSPSPSTPPGQRSFFPGNSRFRVVTVQEPPSISVHGPEENVTKETTPMIDESSQTDNGKIVKCPNSRFSIVRNVEIAQHRNKNVIINYSLGSEKQPKTQSQAVSTDLIKNEDSLKISDQCANKIDTDFQDLDSMKDLDDDRHQQKIDVFSTSEIPSLNNSNSKKTFNVIKKNKSESSLDSPDLEVSRLMQPQGKNNAYDSSSSLDISGSSMESLNTLELNIDTEISIVDKQPASKQAFSTEFSLDSEENDVFGEDKAIQKRGNLSSSNESSLDLSAPVEVSSGNIFHFSNQSFLNSSVSSNESVSPNIFGKHMKLHGSVTSLEASVSSLDSCKSIGNTLLSPGANDGTKKFFSTQENCLIDSADSGIFQSDNSPKTTNDSTSSNEGTLTDNSNLSKMMRSIGSSLEIQGITSFSDKSCKTPKRTASLLDVPSSSSKQRTRKISICSQKKENEELPQQKAQSSLEKLLNIFQNPSSIFSRTVDNSEKKMDTQSTQRRDSQTSSNLSGSFWPWNLGSTSSLTIKSQGAEKPKNTENIDSEYEKNIGRVTSSISAEYTVKLIEKKQLQDDSLTSATAMVSNIPKNSNNNLTSTSVDDESICRLRKYEVLPCDNLDEIESKDVSVEHPKIIYGDICNTADVRAKELQSGLKNDMDADISKCDNKMVQSNMDEKMNVFTQNVTTFSFIDEDNITKNAVQNNLLVLSAYDVGLNPDGENLKSQSVDRCDIILDDESIKKETTDFFFIKSSKIDDAILPSNENIQVEDLEMETETITLKFDGGSALLHDMNPIVNIEDAENIYPDCKDSTLVANLPADLIAAEFKLINMDPFESKIIDKETNNPNEGNGAQKFQVSEISIAVPKSATADIEDATPGRINIDDGPSLKNPSLKIDDNILNTIVLSTKSVESLNEANILSKDFDLLLASDKDMQSTVISTEDIENIKNDFSSSDNCFKLNKKSLDFSDNPSARIAPSILKQSIGLENKTSPNDKQLSPESGPSIDNLPSRIIKRIKENISPENTLTSSMSNTQALVQELAERRKNDDLFCRISEKQYNNESNVDQTESLKSESIIICSDSDIKVELDISDVSNANLFDNNQYFVDSMSSEKLNVLNIGIDDTNIEVGIDLINKDHEMNDTNTDFSNNKNLENENQCMVVECESAFTIPDNFEELRDIDYKLIPEISCDIVDDVNRVSFENIEDNYSVHLNSEDEKKYEDNLQDKIDNFDITDHPIEEGKDVLDVINLSEINTNDTINVPAEGDNTTEILKSDVTFEVSALKQNSGSCDVQDNLGDEILESSEIKVIKMEEKGFKDNKSGFKPISILKKSNERKHCSLPRDIPEHKKIGDSESCRSVEKHAPIRCGSLPESISGYSPKSMSDNLANRGKIGKSRSPINTLGKMARDSLYALNMNDDEIADLAHSKRQSLESVRSLGSVSEDAGDTFPLRKVFSSSESRSLGPCTSQESLASLASISEIAAEAADASKHEDKV